MTRWVSIATIVISIYTIIAVVGRLGGDIMQIAKGAPHICPHRAWMCEEFYDMRKDCKKHDGIVLEEPGRPVACDMGDYIITRHSFDEWTKYTIEDTK